jgi:N-acyl-D-aspartate/D-glutamate deacylase
MVVLTKSRPEYEGKLVADIAKLEGKEPLDSVFDLLLAEEAQVRVVIFGMSEDDVRRVMRSPNMMVGSDGRAVTPEGILGRGKPHPRYYGTFSRVLGHYVREGVLSLPEAVRKMTSMPAQRLGLWDRGRLREGFVADMAVFNQDLVRDEAIFTDPHRFASGILHVIVNGTIVIDDSEHMGTLPGRALRKSK